MIEVYQIKMKDSDEQRTVRVYIPNTYVKLKKKSFPVFYMHDGQNLFDRDTSSYGQIWAVQTVMEKMLKGRGFYGCICVGIDHRPGEERINELSPWICESPEVLGFDKEVGGDGEAYGKFIVDVVKPFIDKKYRTLTDREHTIIGGSSVGGLMSLYLGVEYPETFSKVMAMSPTTWFAPKALEKCLKSFNTEYKTKWYIDVGTEEVENMAFAKKYVEGTQAVLETLRNIGIEDNLIEMKIEEFGNHDELSWSRRLPYAAKWLLNS